MLARIKLRAEGLQASGFRLHIRSTRGFASIVMICAVAAVLSLCFGFEDPLRPRDQLESVVVCHPPGGAPQVRTIKTPRG